jgi:hypothetical protein
MGEIEQPVQRDPDADKTLDDVLFDVVARNKRNRKLVRYNITKDVVTLTYRTPD